MNVYQISRPEKDEVLQSENNGDRNILEVYPHLNSVAGRSLIPYCIDLSGWFLEQGTLAKQESENRRIKKIYKVS